MSLPAEVCNGYEDPAMAKAVARQALAVAEVQRPRVRPVASGRALAQLGLVLLGQGRRGEAEPVLRRALDLLAPSGGAVDVRPEEVAGVQAALARASWSDQ